MRSHPPLSRIRRVFAMALATFTMTLVAVAAAQVVAPAVAHAEGGLEITSNTRYEVQPDSGVVSVLVTMTFVNTVPDVQEGNSIKRAYFSGSSLPIPSGVGDVAVTANGEPLTTSREPGPEGLAVEVARFDFPADLFYGEQTTVEIRYVIEGGGPRNEDDPSRINAAYVGFETWAIGDPGRTTLDIVLPIDFELDISSTLSDVPFTEDGATRVYRLDGNSLSTTGSPSDGFLWAWVSALNRAKLVPHPVEVGGATITVLSWPDDEEWATYAQTTVSDGVPYLEELLGSPWPQPTSEISQSGAPYTLGYAGWFLETDGNIEAGEQLDREVMLHELSHAWLRTPPFNDRWLIEGLAQYVAAKALADLYEETNEPPGESDLAVPLVEWDKGLGGERETEEGGYDESWRTVDAIMDVAGDDKLPELLTAGTENLEKAEPQPDWQVLLDVTEPATGDGATDSTAISDVLVDHVVEPADIPVIEDRNVTRENRSDLVEAADDWGVPAPVDSAIDEWDFDEADDLIGWAEEALVERDALETRAAATQLEVGTGELRADYIVADEEAEYQKIEEDALVLSESIDNVVEAQTVNDSAGGFFYTVGSWFADPPQEQVDAARVALADGNASAANARADAAVAAIEATPGRGRARVLTVLAVIFALMLMAALIVVIVHRSRRRRAADLAARHESPVPPSHLGGGTPSPADGFAPTPAFMQADATGPSLTGPDPSGPNSTSWAPRQPSPDVQQPDSVSGSSWAADASWSSAASTTDPHQHTRIVAVPPDIDRPGVDPVDGEAGSTVPDDDGESKRVVATPPVADTEQPGGDTVADAVQPRPPDESDDLAAVQPHPPGTS